MYYERLSRQEADLPINNWDDKLKQFSRFLESRSRLPQGDPKKRIHSDFVSKELGINNVLALHLLQLAREAGILFTEFTLFSPVDEFPIQTILEPKRLPHDLYDYRNGEKYDKSQYLIRITFVFREDMLASNMNPIFS